jgi:hypothetical protein
MNMQRSEQEHKKQRRSPSVSARVQSVNGDNETMLLDTGSEQTQIAHPFVSGKAWRRSMPSIGTRCTVSYNETLQRYEFVSYAPETATTAKMLSDYRERKSLYRPLLEGEHEDVSSGGVTEFMGSRAVKSGRAGAVRWHYDSDKLEAMVQAPTHVTKGHKSRSDMIQDEKRFGVVKRPVSNADSMYLLAAPLSNPATGSYTYTYEDMTKLSNDNNAPLIDFRSGEVYEDVPDVMTPFALPLLGSRTNLPVRARYRFHNTIEPGGLKAPNQYTDVEIDSLGNLDVILSKLAVLGAKLKIPTGPLSVDVGQSIELIAKMGLELRSQLMGIKLQALQNIELKATQNISLSSTADTSIDAVKNVNINSKLGTTLSSDAATKVSGLTVDVEAKTVATLSGKVGLKLAGAMGNMGRPIATQPTCFVTNLPFFLDPTATL